MNLPKNFQVPRPFIEKTTLLINLPPSAKRQFFLARSEKPGSIINLPATSCLYWQDQPREKIHQLYMSDFKVNPMGCGSAFCYQQVVVGTRTHQNPEEEICYWAISSQLSTPVLSKAACVGPTKAQLSIHFISLKILESTLLIMFKNCITDFISDYFKWGVLALQMVSTSKF